LLDCAADPESTMKHIPFADLPAAERQAVTDVLHRCGMPLRQVCVSKLEAPAAGEEGSSVATVTAGAWCRSYEAHAGWVAQLERDLVAWRASPRGAPAPGD
jgi:hypothetical protein